MSVRRDDFRSLEPMRSWRRLEYQRVLSASEVELFLRGFMPREMEDKWFWYAEDGVVHFHRHWTGIEVYAVRLRQRADGSAEIAEVRTGSNAYDPDQDELAMDILDGLIDVLPRYFEEREEPGDDLRDRR